MHKIKAKQRREDEMDRKQKPPRVVVGPAPKKKEEEENGGGGRGAAVGAVVARAAGGEGVWQTLAGWLFSTRFVSSVVFIFGMVGRFFHVFDPLIQDYKSNFPAYLYCPTITFLFTVSYIAVRGHTHAQSLPQVMTMISCCGVLAGAIIEEQLTQVVGTLLTIEDFIWLSAACVVLSLNIHVLDYRSEGPIKKVLLSLLIVVVPSWVFVISHLFPLSSLSLQTVLLSSFTLAVAIVHHYVTQFRTRVPIFNSVFPAPYIGCLVQCFGMIALSTYYTSWRQSLFSDSWFSFAWMVFAGAPLSVFTLVCHLIHWTSEKIFGPGPHNGAYVLRAVMVSWSLAMVLHHYRPQALAVDHQWWGNILTQATQRLKTTM